MAEDIAELYVDLLKRTLTGSVHATSLLSYGGPHIAALRAPLTPVLKALGRRGIHMVKDAPKELASDGTDWPLIAETMVGMKRLDNIHQCVRTVLDDDVPGDLIETGVWRGGSTIFMRGLLRAYGCDDRTVWVADSFEGLPPPSLDADAGDNHHTFEQLRVSLPEVQDNFRRYGLLDDQVRFLRGWFADTLPTLSEETFAVVRLDGDMYGSTIDGLTALYPRLSPGGFLIVDDYSNPSTVGTKQAVDDYRREHGISEPIEHIDWTGVFWRKQR